MQDAVRCSASAILDTWSTHDWTGGLQIEDFTDLDVLLVRTRNSVYEITIRSTQSGEVLVRGGRFFPEMTPARLAGSSLGGSFLKLRGIYVGFNMELHVGRRAIVTSQVQSISVVNPPTC